MTRIRSILIAAGIALLASACASSHAPISNAPALPETGYIVLPEPPGEPMPAEPQAPMMQDHEPLPQPPPRNVDGTVWTPPIEQSADNPPPSRPMPPLSPSRPAYRGEAEWRPPSAPTWRSRGPPRDGALWIPPAQSRGDSSGALWTPD